VVTDAVEKPARMLSATAEEWMQNLMKLLGNPSRWSVAASLRLRRCQENA
jgi:hypothetical protein